jgi:membrane protein YdbS with pleckstrin-like domain
MSTGHATEVRDDVVITYPHREEPIVQATRAAVVLLLIVSAALMLIVTVGGWNQLEGMIPVDLLGVIIYLTLAYFAWRWNRGVLPVGAALAVLLAVFALVAAPGWFKRNGFGYEASGLNASLLGILTLLIVPVQIALVVFAMRGFKQGWNVERERREPAAQAGGFADAPAHSA